MLLRGSSGAAGWRSASPSGDVTNAQLRHQHRVHVLNIVDNVRHIFRR